MKTVRLTAGLGFYGDAWAPVRAAIERGDVQYVCSDHLAELTLAILQKDRQRDQAGYARDLLPMMADLWPLAAPRGVRFVLNAGGLNPEGARQALVQLFRQKGWQARMAVVTGDGVLDRIDALQQAGEPLAHLDTGESMTRVREQLVFANVYLGARPVAQALAQGADIVITGRVADAALFLAPLLHEFGWGPDQRDQLAQGVVAGHLLECSGQGAGGNFGSAGAWQRIADLAHIGYPIAEVGEDGSLLITKAPGTGGRVDFHTVRQQLLYEVHDPAHYATPDLVVDFTGVRFDVVGPNRVRMSGVRSKGVPPSLKVVGFVDRPGFIMDCEITLAGAGALDRAGVMAQALRQRLQPWTDENIVVDLVGSASRRPNISSWWPVTATAGWARR